LLKLINPITANFASKQIQKICGFMASLFVGAWPHWLSGYVFGFVVFLSAAHYFQGNAKYC